MKTIIVDQRITDKCEYSLLKEGFFIIKLPADNSLGQAVESHPDTVMLYADGEIVTTADYCDTAAYVFSDLREYCPNVKISFTADIRKPEYPYDCLMNALVIGKRIFRKTDTVSDAILELAKRKGYEICHVNQGYPACTVLAFGNSAITADRGMAKVLEEKGIKVTIISQGAISLPPHEYGFIGGASGVYNKKVYFFGDINKHPDCEIIKRAIEDEGYTPISLSSEPLSDFGGIIFL